MPGMSQHISRDDVAHVARLARLRLTDDELDLYTQQLAAVLEHAEDVEALDVGDVEPTAVVALAVASHPDFDDTPLWDENQDGNFGNDGVRYHTHWVILVQDASAPGGWAVRARTMTDKAPPTAPMPDMMMDSPGFAMMSRDKTLRVVVPRDRVNALLDPGTPGQFQPARLSYIGARVWPDREATDLLDQRLRRQIDVAPLEAAVAGLDQGAVTAEHQRVRAGDQRAVETAMLDLAELHLAIECDAYADQGPVAGDETANLVLAELLEAVQPQAVLEQGREHGVGAFR